MKIDTLMRMQASYDIAGSRKQVTAITVRPLTSNPGETVGRETPALVFPLVVGWTSNWLAVSRSHLAKDALASSLFHRGELSRSVLLFAEVHQDRCGP